MRNVRDFLSSIAAVAIFMFSAKAYGDSFDYEYSLSLGNTDWSSHGAFDVLGPPTSTTTWRADWNTDDINLFGIWYLDGLSTDAGPMSRASFVNRASAISIGYSHESGDGNRLKTSDNPLIPDEWLTSGSQSDDYIADLRYVWRDSGWYGNAGVSRSEFTFTDSPLSNEFHVNKYRLGLGKYIGPQTALEFNAKRQIRSSNESDSFSTALLHIGNLSNGWQYGADFVWTNFDRPGSDDDYDLRLSLYPTRSIAFGLDVNGPLDEFSEGPTRVGAFGSWFLKENIEIGAALGRLVNDNSAIIDTEETKFSAGVKIRF